MVGDDYWWNETESSLRGQHPTESLLDHSAVAMSLGDTQIPVNVLDLLGPTDDPNMLGRIGSYEIIGLLGRGGMGAVFKGFDRSLNRFVAIKMLLPHLAASGAARKRFAREAQAVAAVVDDHVMAIHCVDEWQGIPYLVMTYSRGVTLQKRLSDSGPLEVREILRIGMQAAKGLAAAHAQGIVHRDIKPANIFLVQNVERVQLMDFGLARAVDDASLTRTGVLTGTPQYMSPEQARAETVDHRSDLFSLGSVMYAMCTGRPPFRAESSYGVLRLITDKDPRPIREINPNIPEWLVAIIIKLMEKRLDDRYQSANEVARELQDALAHVQNPMACRHPVVSSTPCSSGKGDCSKSFNGVSRMVISKLVLGVLSVVALATVAFVFQPSGGSEQEELSKLQGEWVLESMLKGGIKVPSDQLYNERLVIESTQFARLQTKPDGQEYRGETGRVSVGLHSKRNAIDLHLSKGTIYGVYEIAGDQLVLCINREGGARPDSLSSVPNDNRVLQHFSRTAKSSDAQQVQPPKEAWTDLWLKKIPSELPKNADDAQKWMKENNFDSILSDELTADMAKKINPDVKFEAYGQLGAKTYLFGRLTSASKFATRPSIEVYCFVNELNKVVSMQVNPTQH